MRWFAPFVLAWSVLLSSSCVNAGEAELREFTEARLAEHRTPIPDFPGESGCGRAIGDYRRSVEALRRAKERYDAAALNVIRVAPWKWSSICLRGVDFNRMEFWEVDQLRRMCAAKAEEEYLQARGTWDHRGRYIP